MTDKIKPTAENDANTISQIGTVSLFSDGFKFLFKVNDHNVLAWGSAKSGNEKVFIDDKLTSEQRNFTRRSVHTFMLDGNSYEIEFNTVSLLTGELHCSLIKDGVHVKTLKQVPKYTANKKQTKLRFALWFAMGFVFGAYAIDKIISAFFQ